MSNQARSPDEAIDALRRDPTNPVLVTVDGMAVELRAVDGGAGAENALGELLREIGPWEGDTHDELVAIFRDVRRRSVRTVPSLE